jgi:hypothetical protein
MVSFAFNLANVAVITTTDTNSPTIGLVGNTNITGGVTSSASGVFTGNVTAANFFGNIASTPNQFSANTVSIANSISVTNTAVVGGAATIGGNTTINANATVTGSITAKNLNLTGTITWADGSQLYSGVAGTAIFDYVGNGASTTYPTGNYFSSDKLNTSVFIGGVYQRKNQYDWVGTNIIFGNAPPNGANIEIIVNTLSTSGLANASVQSSSIGQGGPTWDLGGNVSVRQTLYANVIVANTSILSPASTFSVGNVQSSGNVFSGNVTARGTITANYIVANVSFQAGTFQVSNSIVFGDGTSLASTAGTNTFFDYTGDGATTSFSTGNYYATNNSATQVFVGGVYQRRTTYSWVGTNIVFSSPPPAGTNIEILLSLLSYSIGTVPAGAVGITQMSTGAPGWDTTGNVSVINRLIAGSVISNSTITSAGNITVGGNTTVSGNVAVGRALTVSNNTSIGGNVTIGGSLAVTGQITSNGQLMLTVNNALLYNLAF